MLGGRGEGRLSCARASAWADARARLQNDPTPEPRNGARQLIVINGSLAATTNHAFLTAQGTRRAEELRIGETLLRLSSSDTGPRLTPVEITELSQRQGQVLTYNIEVDTYHNYFADGLLVSDR